MVWCLSSDENRDGDRDTFRESVKVNKRGGLLLLYKMEMHLNNYKCSVEPVKVFTRSFLSAIFSIDWCQGLGRVLGGDLSKMTEVVSSLLP
jgi:hypothetical protein